MDDDVLRTARPADVEQLLVLWAVAAENDSRPTDSASDAEALPARDPDACLVVEREGRIVGTVIAGWDGWRAPTPDAS
ncbi:hypothetical protein [Nocardioides sp. CER19]|uniref:hypothetical protein n=1 Tax=Nocardioides sp. CER19 TaxID=3038538 RepID=UPI002448D10B|nr:hypothetical protein [Nocardioides sp. CER19]MDH2414015.1 hypothetical protein [Nocardioides sp. CER19]